MDDRPIRSRVEFLRQRQRKNGSWRVWWEPKARQRALGFRPVELDSNRPEWSVRQAEKLNAEVADALVAAGLCDDGATQPGPALNTARNMAALIELYQKSQQFRKLARATRAGYSRDLARIYDKWGRYPVSKFTKPIISVWHETLTANHGLRQAQSLVRMMSILFSFSETHLGWRPENSNPCLRLRLRSNPPRQRVASWQEYDALIQAALDLDMSAIAAAIALATLTGQRQTDIIAAQCADFSVLPDNTGHEQADNVIIWSLTRSKRGNAAAIELHPECAQLIEPILTAAATQPTRRFLLIDDSTGLPYKPDLFRKRWGVVRARVAEHMPEISDLQFRDLRRTFGAWARDGGVGREEVGDVLGNSAASNWRLGSTYMPPNFESARRAVRAITRPDEAERTRAQKQ